MARLTWLLTHGAVTLDTNVDRDFVQHLPDLRTTKAIGMDPFNESSLATTAHSTTFVCVLIACFFKFGNITTTTFATILDLETNAFSLTAKISITDISNCLLNAAKKSEGDSHPYSRY